jgi:pimeloyl-ACP methyl ester carboxylesterase
VEQETIQLRVTGGSSLPTLIYLPGLHGDWTLAASFRAALRERARFVEFTYPRTTTWTLEDYARGVVGALLAHGIPDGWLLGESFSSQVVWKMIEITRSEKQFAPAGVILAGGFARYPIFPLVNMTRAFNRMIPMPVLKFLLRGYAGYARLRHRRAPETLACIAEFVSRRTEEDRRAILHRYGLILSSNAAEVAKRCELPVYYISGLVDPVVPWPLVRPWLCKNCPGFRESRVIFNADHNVLGTAPEKSAEQILAWMQSIATADSGDSVP